MRNSEGTNPGGHVKRLVVISNRVADLRKTTQTGGLAVGLADAVRERGGVWFGWSGRKLKEPGEPKVDRIGKVTQISLALTPDDYAAYYLGYANSVLWPLFHYRLDLVNFRQEFLDGYRRVNEKFAEAVLPFLRPDDTIWVHDYHLIPLAAELRRRGCRQRIGFFLHIPFPPPDLLAAAPDNEWLVACLFEYDLIGFQTEADLGNFRRYAEEQAGATTREDGSFKAGEHSFRARAFPIGIDVDQFAEMASRASEEVAIDELRRKILGRRQIIGVDRLDYSKGLPDRFKAFGRLLERHPEIHKKVTLLQISPSSRQEVQSYADIKEELARLSGAINSRFADFNWTPIRYIQRNVPREKLAALFRASQVGFVTPLRDGMNLVAKEFVAAQHMEDPGVLVLSQFAGAAEEMTEALIVNPYDIDDMAENLFRALQMPLKERQRRQKALIARIRKQDARAWLTGFLDTLEKVRRAE
ncbi:MAG: alpha,alpha-trehalose-phosphate synthase (UDP-forming) [Rhizobiales bacterium 65-79]|jgi:trehalose 6-phosphate synthase|nr:alpha,alpha-trehalose-phosphate synthase (UDP-forming) [Hyphomicrobiales bacterium]OJU04142.1 MAG: alpha,alpha-trehalose-phosphate synthase (UDP-forming) [Rhizobiales bacterium 65-79]